MNLFVVLKEIVGYGFLDGKVVVVMVVVGIGIGLVIVW